MWEGVGDRTELQRIDPHSYGHNGVSFPFSWAAQPGAWGPSLSGTCSSFQHLLFNWSDLQLTDFLSSPGLYNCSTPTFFLWASQITRIQPVHGQGYILIFLDRMHLLFTQVHFLFWQLGRGQYVILVEWAWVANRNKYATWSLRYMSEVVKVDMKKQHERFSIFQGF